MGLFSRFRRQQRHEAAQSSGIAVADGGMLSLLAPAIGTKALENSAFWDCVRQLCMTYATIPLHLYQPEGKGWNKVWDAPAARLMEHPNYYMTGYAWRWCMGVNFELYGVAFAIIERDQRGKATSLWPVSPRDVSRVPLMDGSYGYLYGPTGKVLGEDEMLKVDHMPVGFRDYLSPLAYAVKDVEIATANKDLQRSFFEKGTNLGGLVSVPAGTKQEVKDAIAYKIASKYSGGQNAYKTLVLDDNMKYEPFRFTDGDSKSLIEAQDWSVKEVARRFGVPASWIGDTSNATVGNSEQQGMFLVQYSLQPRMIAWETALKKICDNPRQYWKFNLAALMRGDHAARSAYYHNGIMDGYLSINEVRELEDMPPIEDGDGHYFPLNYTTLDKVGQSTMADPFGSFGASVVRRPANLEEKVLLEKRFGDAVRSVTRSDRSQVERIIRQQVKAELEYLHGNIALAPDELADGFKTWCGEHAGDWGEKYVPVYQDIMARLYPVVRKMVTALGVGTGEADKDSMEAFAAKCAMDMAARHFSSRASEVRKAMAASSDDDKEDAIDGLDDHWTQDVPATEGQNESHRAGQAFNVYLYAALGVQYMHVQAAADACAFCGQIDGRVVAVDGAVIKKGTDLEDPEGNVMHIHRNLKHPPWHSGCNCIVVPGK